MSDPDPTLERAEYRLAHFEPDANPLALAVIFAAPIVLAVGLIVWLVGRAL